MGSHTTTFLNPYNFKNPLITLLILEIIFNSQQRIDLKDTTL